MVICLKIIQVAREKCVRFLFQFLTLSVFPIYVTRYSGFRENFICFDSNNDSNLRNLLLCVYVNCYLNYVSFLTLRVIKSWISKNFSKIIKTFQRWWADSLGYAELGCIFPNILSRFKYFSEIDFYGIKNSLNLYAKFVKTTRSVFWLFKRIFLSVSLSSKRVCIVSMDDAWIELWLWRSSVF